MNRSLSTDRFRHSSLALASNTSLLAAELTDRQRMSAILQLVALRSHLARAGLTLVESWKSLSIDDDGRICGVQVASGPTATASGDFLVELLHAMFGSDNRIQGKGQVRRICRSLLGRCSRTLWMASADRLVTQLLDAAPFLWQPAWSATRGALVASIEAETGTRILVAGPRVFESRVKERAATFQELGVLIQSRQAGRLWSGLRPGSGPAELMRQGRWQDASRAWQLSRPRTPRQRLQAAYSLGACGRFREAEAMLSQQTGSEAELVRAQCRSWLGRSGAAYQVLNRWASSGKPIAGTDSVADLVAGIVLGRRRDRPISIGDREWVAETRGGTPPDGLHLVEAAAAICEGDKVSARRLLDAASAAGVDPTLAWCRSWLQARLESATGNPGAAGDLLTAALLEGHRRDLRPYQAAILWADLAELRLAGDRLKSAHKAARHAMRLLAAVDSGPVVCCVLKTLLEISLRRGDCHQIKRLEDSWPSSMGESSTEAWRSDGDRLRARIALLQGEPERALEELAQSSSATDSGQHAILKARALGWLGRVAAAREALQHHRPEMDRELEAEEWPAIWALAGDRQQALEACRSSGPTRLWLRALQGEAARSDEWSWLEGLEPYRAARMVFDLVLATGIEVPQRWQGSSIQELRRVGAMSFAERLERRSSGPWRVLETYLRPSRDDASAVGELFTQSGYFDTRLSWTHENNEIVLVDGGGGNCALEAPSQGGLLTLKSNHTDPIVRALFALAARDFRPPSLPRRVSPRVRGFVGSSEALARSLHRLERLAGRELAVLIHGETGTGKEIAARQLHTLSARSSARFVAVNCSALSESLILSDLFGHVRGAYTGADRDRAGIFEVARGGIVFLDEIGDLPLSAQGKLLRVLQEGEVRRVGESLPRRVEVRVVAATHCDLTAMVETGDFRRDLLYRLRVGCIELPPLRERGRDVLLLADHFLAREGYSMTPRAAQRLLSHDWPGNVRELQNILEVAVALSDGQVLDVDHLELPEGIAKAAAGYHRRVDDLRRKLVEEALEASGGNRAAAARKLELSRQALSYLVRKLGIE